MGHQRRHHRRNRAIRDVDRSCNRCHRQGTEKNYIEKSHYVAYRSANTILRIIEEDKTPLSSLQIQVQGISSARIDIINGGPRWWFQNYKGIGNVFSAVSLRPLHPRPDPSTNAGNRHRCHLVRFLQAAVPCHRVRVDRASHQ